MRNLVYLASPYTDPDPAVMESRFDEACRAAAALMKKGVFVFSPIAHSHPIARFGLPLDFEYWKTYDAMMLAFCSRMIVLQIDGWDTSVGVQFEIEIAEKLNMQIEYRAG